MRINAECHFKNGNLLKIDNKITGPRFTKIRKSYEFVRPIV